MENVINQNSSNFNNNLILFNMKTFNDHEIQEESNIPNLLNIANDLSNSSSWPINLDTSINSDASSEDENYVTAIWDKDNLDLILNDSDDLISNGSDIILDETQIREQNDSEKEQVEDDDDDDYKDDYEDKEKQFSYLKVSQYLNLMKNATDFDRLIRPEVGKIYVLNQNVDLVDGLEWIKISSSIVGSSAGPSEKSPIILRSYYVGSNSNLNKSCIYLYDRLTKQIQNNSPIVVHYIGH